MCILYTQLDATNWSLDHVLLPFIDSTASDTFLPGESSCFSWVKKTDDFCKRETLKLGIFYHSFRRYLKSVDSLLLCQTGYIKLQFGDFFKVKTLEKRGKKTEMSKTLKSFSLRFLTLL